MDFNLKVYSKLEETGKRNIPKCLEAFRYNKSRFFPLECNVLKNSEKLDYENEFGAINSYPSI